MAKDTFQDLLANQTGEIGIPKTEFRISLKKDILEAEFFAHDSSLKSYSDINNSDLWRGNVVELFLDFGDEFYYEFEVAPNGATFVAEKHQDKLVFIDDKFFKATTERVGNTYHVFMEINLKKLGKSGNFKFNAFRIEEETPLSLSPTFCDTFHVRSRFISL